MWWKELEFLFHIEEEPTFAFSVKGILKAQHYVVGRHQVKAGAGANEQLVGQAGVGFVVGIVPHVTEVGIGFSIQCDGKVTELFYRSATPTIGAGKNFFFKRRLVKQELGSFNHEDLISPKDLLSESKHPQLIVRLRVRTAPVRV